MAADSMVAAQIVRLLRQHPPGIWDLLDVQDAARTGDVVLRDQSLDERGAATLLARVGLRVEHVASHEPRRASARGDVGVVRRMHAGAQGERG